MIANRVSTAALSTTGETAVEQAHHSERLSRDQIEAQFGLRRGWLEQLDRTLTSNSSMSVIGGAHNGVSFLAPCPSCPWGHSEPVEIDRIIVLRSAGREVHNKS